MQQAWCDLSPLTPPPLSLWTSLGCRVPVLRSASRVENVVFLRSRARRPLRRRARRQNLSLPSEAL